jgi:CRISPR-associated endonuclease/helicase Cas3
MLSYIAHVSTPDQRKQTVATHLQEVAELAKAHAAKINIPEAGELIGLLHDFGKYSKDFQDYIKSGTGLIDPDSDDFIDAKAKKGKVDHSTAGAQWIWQALSKYGKNGEGKLCGQILALCIASHHSGLIDCLAPYVIDNFYGTNNFKKRIGKADDKCQVSQRYSIIFKRSA